MKLTIEQKISIIDRALNSLQFENYPLICNVVSYSMYHILNLDNNDFLNLDTTSYLEKYWPELYKAINEEGVKLNGAYFPGLPWRTTPEHRLKWLSNYKVLIMHDIEEKYNGK